MNFGEKIKSRREELNMTQLDLAKAAGYTDRSTISKIEKGLTDVPTNKIKSLAMALKMNPADFFDYSHLEKDPERLGRLSARILADHELMLALEKFFTLTGKQQKAIIDSINSY